jgi:hypothetical protein
LAGWPRAEGGGAAPPRTGEQVREAVDRKVDEKVEAHRTRLRQEGRPPDADHLAGLIYALLVQCRDAGHLYGILEVERLPPPRQGARPTYDLAVVQPGPRNGQTIRTGIRVLTATSARSVAGFLRRLLEDPQPLDRLLLVTEERVGLPLGDRGAEYLHELRQGGPDHFQALELICDECAELDSLQAVVGLARSGDLEVESRPGETRPVTAEEVIDSLHRRGRYRNTRLFRALLGRNAVTAPAEGSEVLTP